MAITGLPEITARQILTKSDLDAIINALTAKMAGAIGTSDIGWPLVVGGDIDFDDEHNILNLRTFWNIYNAEEYGLQEAIDAAEEAGGGCVIIPPDTEIIAQGITIDGDNITIMGFGSSSVIKANAASDMFTLGSVAERNNIVFMNFKMDGDGTSANGIVAKRIDDLKILNMWIVDFTADGIVITNRGTDGYGCTDVRIMEVKCEDNGSNDIFVDDVDGLLIDGFISRTCSGDSIYMETDTESARLRDIEITDVRIISPGGKGISILGEDSIQNLRSRIHLSDCKVYDPTDDGYEVGEASKRLQKVEIDNCVAYDVPSGKDAFVANVSNLSIQNCKAYSPGGDGLDLVSSKDGFITNNILVDAGAYAIDADGTTDCHIYNNNLHGFTTGAVKRSNATGLKCGGNYGDFGPLFGTNYSEYIDFTSSGTTDAQTAYTYTIPANTLNSNMGVIVHAIGAASGGNSTATVQLKVDGNAVAGSASIDALSSRGIVITGYMFLNDEDPDASNNTNYWGSIVVDESDSAQAGQPDINTFTNTTIDWTSDVTMLINVQLANKSDTVRIEHIFFEYFGGNQV